MPIAPAVTGHEVLQRIHQSRHEVDAPGEAPGDVAATASTSLPAFVSLARAAAGEAGVADVLALGSTLLAGAMPGATGAWYLPDVAQDRLTVADAFGAAAGRLRGMSVPVGDRLTGWVAASRQPIINSDAALDLGMHVDADTPPLSRCSSLPLIAGDALVAVLTLYTAAPDGFTAEQGRAVQLVAPHLAWAINAALRTERARCEVFIPEQPGSRGLRLVAWR